MGIKFLSLKKGKVLNNRSGFTLLEVLIALSIFAVVYGSIVVTQINSNLSLENSKKLTIAAMLLKNKMLETEAMIEGKAFVDLKKEEKGVFEGNDDSKDFTWTRVVKEIEFPNLASGQADPTADANAEADDDNAGAGGNQLMDKIAQVSSEYFNDSIREITVTITWTTPKGIRSTSATTYWVDLTKNVQF